MSIEHRELVADAFIQNPEDESWRHVSLSLWKNHYGHARAIQVLFDWAFPNKQQLYFQGVDENVSKELNRLGSSITVASAISDLQYILAAAGTKGSFARLTYPDGKQEFVPAK